MANKTDLELALAHKYRLPNGTKLTNVTAISGLMDMGKSNAFAGAAVKLTKQGINYREVWNEKGNRGTRVHGHCEKWLQGEDAEVADDEAGFVDGLQAFWEDHAPELIAAEEIVVSSRGYGGRFDMIVEPMKGEYEGDRCLIDLKTGKQYLVEHTLQLAAYRFADGMARFDDWGHLDHLMPLPEITRTFDLYVNEDGSYQLKEYPADPDAFAQFCHLLAARNWATSDTMKQLDKEARTGK